METLFYSLLIFLSISEPSHEKFSSMSPKDDVNFGVASNLEVATFAANCFWEPDARFGAEKGVHRTRVGYTGGTTLDPTYISLGDHTEAIQVQFDPSRISYKRLLEIFWSLHDVTERQITQYRSAIFIHNEKQRKTAEQFIQEKQKKMRHQILTKVEDASQFYNAEGYHQKYRLRQSPSLMQHFQHVSDDEFMDSFVAAKLNGYKGIYNSNAKATQEALKEYKMSHPDAIEHIDAVLDLI